MEHRITMKIYNCNEQCLGDFISLREKYEQGIPISMMVNKRVQPFVVDSVGVVDIRGMLLKDSTELDRELGSTDYDDIIDDIDYVLSQGAKSIILNVNSGGGMAQGSFEVAEYIKNAPVPTVAFVEGMAGSAAYKIISPSTAIIASPSGITGSIGTIMIYSDRSKMFESVGVNLITFTNSEAKYKSIGHGNTALTQEQGEYLQEQVQKAGTEFIEYVSTNRIVDNEVFTAATYSGFEAVNVGLVDAVAGYREAFNIAKQLGELAQINNF